MYFNSVFIHHWHSVDVKESIKETVSGATEYVKDTGSSVVGKGQGKFVVFTFSASESTVLFSFYRHR